jgi:multicomponent Na+:H+ antiporter subunit B
MNDRVRHSLFLVAASIVGGVFLWGVLGLPVLGNYRGPYGDVLNNVAVTERHTTDVVAAVTFDYRGFDTLAEEFILFAAVVGVTVLLRKHPGEAEQKQEDRAPSRQVPKSSDAVRLLATALVGPTVVFGLAVVTHGHLTPGGGFQGGVILATAPLLVYLAGEFDTFRRIASHVFIEVAEAIGAGGFIVLGSLGLLGGAPFLQNVLPLGQLGELFSAGIIPLLNLTVAVAVSAGFLLLLLAFLEEVFGAKET